MSMCEYKISYLHSFAFTAECEYIKTYRLCPLCVLPQIQGSSSKKKMNAVLAIDPGWKR